VPQLDDATTWRLIHAEREAVADVLATLTPEQWAQPSLCGGWSVQQAAGHIVAGAEQTRRNFAKRMAASAFRFNVMIDRDARKAGTAPPRELIDRLRARTTTTNRPPAPVITMLGEIVVHGQDIVQPLGLVARTSAQAVTSCLAMYQDASFPVGAKARIRGLRLRANDVEWTHGDGPEVSGPGLSLLLAMTGRAHGLDALTGDGLTTLRDRMRQPVASAA
jgi:uncharacterized protein (TIGR03083 family)